MYQILYNIPYTFMGNTPKRFAQLIYFVFSGKNHYLCATKNDGEIAQLVRAHDS